MPVLQLDEAMFKVLVKELQTKALKHIQTAGVMVKANGVTASFPHGLDGIDQAMVEAAVEFTLSHLIKIKR